ncbi:hypothetical protein DV517_61880 [Streptomyces sp. S816]|uniref:hypothetical protein n=1 Tax=Streptomyces sp. S816 TaxID=2283197 RepID=UPI00109D3033|nr:hypothetical protein [Streptomyces sp. S816]TGZ14705.1 hypothetical protein DV517_61880 [Streptomyces sp. S816]
MTEIDLDAIETAARNAARIGSGIDPGVTTALVAEVRRLRARVTELEGKTNGPDTLAAWLHWRFGTPAEPWSEVPDEDKACWEHQARAVRRAVARDGFKTTAPTGQPEPEAEAIHGHFGLSYANYLVLPRTLLQSMDDAWQTQFVALLNEMADAFQRVPQAEGYEVTTGQWMDLADMTESQLYAVGIDVEGDDEDGPGTETRYHRRSDGAELQHHDRAFVPGPDPVPHYNRGRTYIAPAVRSDAV